MQKENVELTNETYRKWVDKSNYGVTNFRVKCLNADGLFFRHNIAH